VTDTQLLKDEPILEAKLSGKGAGRGLAAVIPMGMRAVTVRTPNVACGVGGFALPGNKVDLLLTVNGLNDSTGGGSTTTLLQNVEILAVDQRLDAPTSNMMDLKELRSVTLLVTPDQAAKVDLGQNMGTLHLSLRNPQDKEPGGAGVATLSDLRIFQGRPWDERLKSVLDMASKMMAARKPEKEKTETPAVAKEPPPAVPPKIRTLRGTVQGEVAFQ
jgi:Flp pilus assembly protein CpaB